MQSDYLPELGEEFAAISSGVCGISPLMAKLILYTELDDGYGRYFRSIFSEEDRKSPYFVQDVGTPMPRRLNSVSPVSYTHLSQNTPVQISDQS